MNWDDLSAEQLEMVKKLDQQGTLVARMLLEITESEEDVRKFQARALKAAQEQWAKDHQKEIMNAMEKGLDSALEQAKREEKQAEERERMLLEAIKRAKG